MPTENDLGPCCSCGGLEGVRNVITLEKKAPEAGKGWGCLQCHLPPDGAVAVLCDECHENGREPVHACVGYPSDGHRIPVAELQGEHKHDMEKHPEVPLPGGAVAELVEELRMGPAVGMLMKRAENGLGLLLAAVKSGEGVDTAVKLAEGYLQDLQTTDGEGFGAVCDAAADLIEAWYARAADSCMIIRGQHEAIDILFAMLVEATKDGPNMFFPSKSGKPWLACQLGAGYIRGVEALRHG